jgi:malonyl-CoA decarboxylase
MRSAWPNDAFAKAQVKLASLILRRIDVDTPETVLEKLIRYEAVHKIHGWRDLRRRLESDRRCYALFDRAHPDEPVIFVEVALVKGMSGRVQPLIDPDAVIYPAEAADSAIFYSITKCQEGLRGMPFGGFLINEVLEKMSVELPQLRRFATLSPLPSFHAWLRQATGSAAYADGATARLRTLLSQIEQPNWIETDEVRENLRRDLVPLCAYYLISVKNGAEPLDPVARFHLRNGARLERINWLADTSPAGVGRSGTIMANYVYRPAPVERNQEQYVRKFKVIASSKVQELAESCFLSPQDDLASGV